MNITQMSSTKGIYLSIKVIHHINRLNKLKLPSVATEEAFETTKTTSIYDKLSVSVE